MCRGLYSLVDWNASIHPVTASCIVEAYTASWIEISNLWSHASKPPPSRLIQPRGLKCGFPYDGYQRIQGRGLYSLVDWNTHWRTVCSALPCRGLYSLVDWNKMELGHWWYQKVEAYTASWIEISTQWAHLLSQASRLIQPRGLKCILCVLLTVVIESRLIQPRGLKLRCSRNETVIRSSRLIQPRGLKWLRRQM